MPSALLKSCVCSIVLVFGIFFHLNGQGFTNTTFIEGIDHSYAGLYGGGISTFDFNNDGWDDITICTNNTPLAVYINNEGSLSPFFIDIAIPGQAKMVNWVDFDNDGDNDLSVSFVDHPFQLFENDGAFNFTNISIDSGLELSEALSYGHSWGDINNDGWLDLYISNYNGSVHTNFILQSNGDGTFTDITTGNIANDGFRYSFLATFIDYNQDGWQDLFVINDRLESRNSLYKNVEGTFVDVSEEAGVDQHIFSMSNSLNDFNKDGLWDLYVSNNPFGNLMLQGQEDHSFVDVADSTGCVVYDMSWGATFIDFDNDKDEDLFVCGTPFWGEPGLNKFFINQEGEDFEMDNSVGFSNYTGWQYSAAVSDYNNDGYQDLAILAGNGDNSTLFKNTGYTNNYIKIALEGTESNAQGIGSHIEIWSNGDHQMRYTQCGEGYLSQHSQYEIIGMGTSDLIDSLRVKWLSGWEDVFYNVDVNQTLNITEGSSFPFEVSLSSPFEPCADSAYLSISLPPETFWWNTGETSPNIVVNQAGWYVAYTEHPFGHVIADSVFLDFSNPASLEVVLQNPSCFDEASGIVSITSDLLTFSIDAGNTWQDLLVIENLNAGAYGFAVLDEQGCEQEIYFDLIAPEELLLDLEIAHILCNGELGHVTPIYSGGTGLLDYQGPSGSCNEGVFECVVTDEQGCSVVQSIEVFAPEELVASIALTNPESDSDLGFVLITPEGGVAPYSNIWTNGLENLWESDQLSLGVYEVLISDSNECTVLVNFEIDDTYAVIEFQDQQDQLVVFPNPAEVHTHIEVESNGFIEIYSASGQLIQMLAVQKGYNELDLSSLAPGVYHLSKLEATGKRYSQLIKQ